MRDVCDQLAKMLRKQLDFEGHRTQVVLPLASKGRSFEDFPMIPDTLTSVTRHEVEYGEVPCAKLHSMVECAR